jgi:hypothetical protein
MNHQSHQRKESSVCIGITSLVSTSGNQGGGYIAIGDSPIAESTSCLIGAAAVSDVIGAIGAQTEGNMPISSTPIFNVLTGKKSIETGEGYEEKEEEGSTYEVWLSLLPLHMITSAGLVFVRRFFW